MGNEDVVCRNKCYSSNDLAVITNGNQKNVKGSENITNGNQKKKNVKDSENITNGNQKNVKDSENITNGNRKNVKDSENKIKNDDKTEDNGVDFVQILPMELIEEILLYLEPKDLAAATAVSSSWREAVNSNKVWGYICDKKGWKDDFDPTFSHFYKAHKQFRRWAHSNDSFTPTCQKRLLYNKNSCLLRNWRNGKCIPHKVCSTSSSKNVLQLFEPVACDDRYLVVTESTKRSQEISLAVWSLDGIPSRLYELPLPSPVKPVEAIAFSYGMVVIVQDWILIVYEIHSHTFDISYIKDDLKALEPINGLLNNMRLITPFLKITQDFIICVPNYSHSTEHYLPIFFWDKESGELKNKLNFDSMYLHITCAFWSDESCYLALTNKKTKSYQIVEFSTKSAEWEFFISTVSGVVEQIIVNDQYILAVSRVSIFGSSDFWSRTENNKELFLWERGTNLLLKTFKTQGRSFQFVGDYIMYFDGSNLIIMNPKDPNIRREFEVSGTITSIRACNHPSTLIVVKTGCYIEIWDWVKGSRLYTVTAATGYGNQLWCDDKRIITYHSTSKEDGCGLMVLGFW